jgi:AcrR family transcriptional regulator
MATRTRQRERTRQQILDALARLVDRDGVEPAVDQLSVEAGVSRATFYRYFGSPAEALFQLFTDRQLPSVEETLGGVTGLAERVRCAGAAVNGYLLSDPNATRAFERAMLERSLNGTATAGDRPARRLEFIDAALEPIQDRLSSDDLHLIRHALALTMGSSVVPALLDTCGLDGDEAARVAAFAATVIAEHAQRLAAPEALDTSTVHADG